MFSFTIFKSKFDSRTHKRMDFETYDEFENIFFKLSKVEYKSKEEAPLISPATFAKSESDSPTAKLESNKKGNVKPFIHRKNINVMDWGKWAALDVDDWIPKSDLKEELNDRFNNRYICYSTASSTVSHPKFRLVFPLTRRVDKDEIKSFWYALVQESGLQIDAQCKDLSRMYYVPANYCVSSDTHNFIFVGGTRDEFIDPTKLINKHPAPPPKSNSFFDNLPEEVQVEIIERKKQKLENTDFQWTSYRNCPFWPKKLAAEYMNITDSGWYVMLYKIMVVIASNAIKKKYPITAIEIAQLCFEFDLDTGGWYKDRPLETEANRALEYVYRNM